VDKKILFGTFLISSLGLAQALDIAGTIKNKVGEPIESARVCLQAAPGHCTLSNSKGVFHISEEMIQIRNPRRFQKDFNLNAILKWFDSRGRVIYTDQNIILKPGQNTLVMPRVLAKEGQYFVQQEPQEMPVKVLALSKAMLLSNKLIITKTGYKDKIYQPITNSETDAVITLTAIDDRGIILSLSQIRKVISIDRVNHVIITEEVNLYCDSATVITDTIQSTNNYAIQDGKLYLWTDGDCEGSSFTGTSSDLVGSWVLSEDFSILPVNLQTPGCYIDSSQYPLDFFQSPTGFLKITPTLEKSESMVEICLGSYYQYFIENLFNQNSGVKFTKNTCLDAELKNSKNETASLVYSQSGNEYNISFTFKNTTCSFSQNFNLDGSIPTCPMANPTTEFFPCMAQLGFATTTLLKTSAQKSYPIKRAWGISLDRTVSGIGLVKTQKPFAHDK
jgi:hypothetical protein